MGGREDHTHRKRQETMAGAHLASIWSKQERPIEVMSNTIYKIQGGGASSDESVRLVTGRVMNVGRMKIKL
jgi:hypothetical protein